MEKCKNTISPEVQSSKSKILVVLNRSRDARKIDTFKK